MTTGGERASSFPATAKVLALLCFMYALTYIDRVNVSTAAPVFGRELGLSNTQVGLVFSAFAYPYLVFQILGGWVGDRYGARLALTVCAVIWALSTLFIGFAGSLTAILLARLALGFGEGATFPVATRAMSDWTPAGRRGFAQGITHAAARLGNALTPPLVAWLIAVITWRGSFIVLGVISLVWAGVWWAYFCDNPAEHGEVTKEHLRRLPVFRTREERRAVQVPWGKLTRRMLPVTFVYFCYGWTLWLYLAWIPLFFLNNYKLNLRDSALFAAGVFFGGVVGDTLGGVISDRLFEKTGDPNRARRNLVVFGFIVSVLSMTPILFVHDVTVAAICLSAAFFFSEFTVGPMWAIPMDIAPKFSGSASGVMNSGSALAAIVSPLIAGYVIDKTGNWDLPFVGSIALLLAGSITAFWMRPGDVLDGGSPTLLTPSVAPETA